MVIRTMTALCFVLTSVSASAETFSLDCENVAATQFNMGPDGFDNYKAATDTYTTKYVYKGKTSLWFKYPASSNSALKKSGKLFKNSFYETTNLASFYEFVDNSSEYLKTYSFHKRERDGLTWRLSITNNGNNDGKLYQRTYWYHCKQIVGE